MPQYPFPASGFGNLLSFMQQHAPALLAAAWPDAASGQPARLWPTPNLQQPPANAPPMPPGGLPFNDAISPNAGPVSRATRGCRREASGSPNLGDMLRQSLGGMGMGGIGSAIAERVPTAISPLHRANVHPFGSAAAW